MAKRISLEVRSGSSFHTVVGLSTQLKDYRLSFLLNKLPGFRFSRFEELMVPHPESPEPLPFSIYTSSDEETLNTYTLLSNRSGDHLLLASLRQTDYLLIIEGPFKKQQMTTLLSQLRSIREILLAAEINAASIKQFEQLISDLELHRIAIKNNLKKGGTHV